MIGGTVKRCLAQGRVSTVGRRGIGLVIWISRDLRGARRIYLLHTLQTSRVIIARDILLTRCKRGRADGFRPLLITALPVTFTDHLQDERG